jgi:hypothetical protein
MERGTPSLAAFCECCRREFMFLTQHGFGEVVANDKANPFQITYARDQTKIVIVGEGYGTVVRTTVVLPDGRQVAPAQLVPGFSPKTGVWRKRAKLSQLEQIAEDAVLLHSHGVKLWSSVAT